jgi:hypothetical protein
MQQNPAIIIDYSNFAHLLQEGRFRSYLPKGDLSALVSLGDSLLEIPEKRFR